MKVLEAAMKATQMPQLGRWGRTAMKAEFPTKRLEAFRMEKYRVASFFCYFVPKLDGHLITD
ncbi:hypothetical protein L195_g020779 [Trifolium pratense]|uniref:Uncharacterized protein n=1 Tax=Trifolium pratense TaxID=57577 RepID=A0A2K3N3D1_TRIPR|nr:hypothetical protein L195_g020779 [Trifolium pratense]